MEKDLKMARMRLELKDNPAKKEIIEVLTQTVLAANQTLVYNRDIEDTQRRVLMAERDVYWWFLRLFSSSEEQIKKIAHNLNKRYG